MKIIPFQLDHLKGLPTPGRVSPWYFDSLAESISVTLVTDKVIGCGGVIENANGMGTLWASFNKDTGPHMTAITRAARRLMEACAYRRYEATVEEGFPAGCRWLQILGFELETPKGMRGFGPDGKTHYLYGWAAWRG